MKTIALSFMLLLGTISIFGQNKTRMQRVEVSPGTSVVKKIHEMSEEGVIVQKHINLAV